MKKLSPLSAFQLYLIYSLFSPICIADSNSEIPIIVTSAWENKYVSEGRDNLESGGLFSFDIFTTWQQLTLGGWFAQGDSQSYQEVNLYIEYGFEFYSFDSYINYTRLEFPKENEKDNEYAIGLAYSELTNITPSIDYTWSSNSDGGFLELSLNARLDLQKPHVVINPYILQAFDFGYATSDHDGPNNLQVGIEAMINLNNYARLSLHVNHSFAQEDIEQDDMDDVTWFGVSLIGNI